MYKAVGNEDPESEESKTNRDEVRSKESSTLSPAGATRGNYGTAAAQEKAAAGAESRVIPWCGLILYFMSFSGLFCAFCLRTSLSQAVVAMVNTTSEFQQFSVPNVSEYDQCPRDPELQLLNGELDWSRYQQAMVLAAFYYGHEFTQVNISRYCKERRSSIYHTKHTITYHSMISP